MSITSIKIKIEIVNLPILFSLLFISVVEEKSVNLKRQFYLKIKKCCLGWDVEISREMTRVGPASTLYMYCIYVSSKYSAT